METAPMAADELSVDLARRAVLGAVASGGMLAALPISAAGRNSLDDTPEAASLALDRAIVAQDTKTLDQLIAADFLWVRGGGVRADKAAFIAGLAAPGVVIEPFTPTETRWLKSAALAVLSAVNELRGSDQGKPFVDRHSFCDVWRHDAKGWRLVYTQVTRAPPIAT